MKIEKLKKDQVGKYDLADLPDKINEIIDVLNKSFITDEPDTAFVTGMSVTDVIRCPYCEGENITKYYAMNDTLCYKCMDCGKELFI